MAGYYLALYPSRPVREAPTKAGQFFAHLSCTIQLTRPGAATRPHGSAQTHISPISSHNPSARGGRIRATSGTTT